MTTEEVLAVAGTLRSYAGHFSPRDWDWTRDHRVKRITYRPPRRPSRTRGGRRRWFDPSQLPARLWSALRGLFRSRESRILPGLRTSRWRTFRARLRYNSLPDGCLDGGNVLCYWEETGEYLQMVQPSVGLLIADMLEDRPDDAHSRAIAGEVKRVLDRYSARIEANGGNSV